MTLPEPPKVPIALTLLAAEEPGHRMLPGVSRLCRDCHGTGEVGYVVKVEVGVWRSMGVGLCRTCSGHGRVSL